MRDVYMEDLKEQISTANDIMDEEADFWKSWNK